jgi:hypothetical protein
VTGTVIIGGERLPVTLDAAKGGRTMAALGPTETHHGVTLTAIASRIGSSANLTLVPTYHGPFTIWDVTPTLIDHGDGITITGPNGRVYPAHLVFNLGPNNQFTFTPGGGITRYRVVVPRVDATYTGQAQVSLPVPVHGSLTLDETVDLGGFPLTITKVTRIGGASGALRAYLNLHASLARAKSLHDFQINTSAEAQIDTQTGAWRWIQVAVGRHTRWVTWELTAPAVYIKGPWVFHVDLAPVSADRRP